MIYQAVERDWGTKGLSVSEMVQAGVWYLEQARENIEEMQEEGNWKELIEEDHRVVLQLFGLSPGQRYSAARQMGSKAPWTHRVSD
jgi:tRNA-dihydrouridine synthase